MHISLLREFITLSKNLNFSKSAQQLYITQSVLSKHIALLEQQIGTPLFIRDRQSVKLTELGELFLEEAIDIVKRFDEGIERINVALNKTKRELKIGYLDAHSRSLLVSIVQKFEAQSPNVKLNLMAFEYSELPKRLKYKDVDIIFTLNIDKSINSWCSVYKIYKDVLCLVTRHDHPLAKLKTVKVSSLMCENILIPETEELVDYAAFLNGIFEAEIITKNIAGKYTHVNSSLLMVEAGKGVVILPKKLSFNANEKIRFVPIDGSKYTIDVIAAWRKNDKNPLIGSFMKVLSDSS